MTFCNGSHRKADEKSLFKDTSGRQKMECPDCGRICAVVKTTWGNWRLPSHNRWVCHRGDIRKLRFLQGEQYHLLLDSQELDHLLENIGKANVDYFTNNGAESVTGAIVMIHDGDYVQVWLTGYRAPYNIESDYTCVVAK